MTRVVVTGASGQLGSTVVARFSPRCEVTAFTRAQLDIADEPAVLAALAAARPDVVINCAAYNNVDGAEDAVGEALAANAFGVLALARAAAAAGATFVHYSTDFVFDGAIDRPYRESDAPRPLGAYGTSKLLGEWFARDAGTAYVLRVESLFGGQPAKSSVDKIIAKIRAGEPAQVFVDRHVSPSYVDDVTTATEEMLAIRPASGVYHCVNDGVVTWYDIAQEAARLLQREATLVPVKVADVTLRAQRPKYCALSNQKLRDAGIVLPTWQSALARYIGSVVSR